MGDDRHVKQGRHEQDPTESTVSVVFQAGGSFQPKMEFSRQVGRPMATKRITRGIRSPVTNVEVRLRRLTGVQHLGTSTSSRATILVGSNQLLICDPRVAALYDYLDTMFLLRELYSQTLMFRRHCPDCDRTESSPTRRCGKPFMFTPSQYDPRPAKLG